MSASSADVGPDSAPHVDSTITVSLRSVAVRYPGGPVALVDVDVDVTAGERVALLGSSGAGKSTLLDVVAGLVDPTAGDVVVLGTHLGEIGGAAFRRHRAKVGVIRQHHGLPGSMRVVHNVNSGLLGRWSTARALASLVVAQGREDVDAVLDCVGLAGFADRRTGDLSGGQQQRVAVARVLLQQPDLILADEPVSAVDPKLSADVVALLCDRNDRQAARRTTVISLHDPDLARSHVDRVVGLTAGKVAFDLAVGDVDDALLADLYRNGR